MSAINSSHGVDHTADKDVTQLKTPICNCGYCKTHGIKQPILRYFIVHIYCCDESCVICTTNAKTAKSLNVYEQTRYIYFNTLAEADAITPPKRETATMGPFVSAVSMKYIMDYVFTGQQCLMPKLGPKQITKLRTVKSATSVHNQRISQLITHAEVADVWKCAGSWADVIPQDIVHMVDEYLNMYIVGDE